MTIDDATRQRILRLWASGISRNEISAQIGTISAKQVGSVVDWARESGDRRADRRARQSAVQAKIVVTPDRYPDYSAMSLTGLLFGDPAPTRSALWRKQHSNASS